MLFFPLSALAYKQCYSEQPSAQVFSHMAWISVKYLYLFPEDTISGSGTAVSMYQLASFCNLYFCIYPVA